MVCWYRFLIAIPSFVMMLCALSYMAGLCGAPSRPREQWIDAGNTGQVSSNVPLDSAEVRDGIPPPMCIACNAAPQRRPYDYCGGLTTCLNAAEEAISAAGATTAAPTAPPAHLPAAMAPPQLLRPLLPPTSRRPWHLAGIPRWPLQPLILSTTRRLAGFMPRQWSPARWLLSRRRMQACTPRR